MKRMMTSLNINKSLNIIIIGPPGGGKGTISKKLVKDFQFSHVSMGDLLRAEVLSSSVEGIKIKSIMQQGHLVPDDIVIDIMMKAIARKDRVLLDGYPRTIEQATYVEKKIPIDAVIALDIPHQTIIDRISKRWVHAASGRTYAYDYNPPKVQGRDDVTNEELTQRDDDKPETVRTRLENYASMTSPLLVYFEKKGMVKSFQGTESDVIYPQIKDFLIDKFKL